MNINKINFEAYGDLVNQAYSKLIRYWLTIKDQHNQIANNKTSVAEYPNENDSEDTEGNRAFAIPNFMSQLLPDDEIAKNMDPLSSKKTEVFNVVYMAL